MEIGNYFLSLAAFAPLVVLITDFFVRWLKINAGWLKQVLSWAVSVLLSFVGMAFDLGLFAGVPVWQVVIYGLAAGLVANGIFDIKLVQMLLDFIFKLIPKKE